MINQEKIFHLLYVSKVGVDFHESELPKLIEISRRNNASRNLTGLLLFGEGYFVQLLEGQEDVVRTLLQVIKRDPRHFAVKTLVEAFSDARLMPEWSMASIDSSRLSGSMSDLIDLFEASNSQMIHASKETLMLMLKKFTYQLKPLAA